MKAFVGFAGFGGVDIALREFGFDVIGIEIDDAIAEVNRRNGGHCLTQDILDVDPLEYQDVTLAHFSPVCTSYSLANQSSGESALDIQFARWIARFIDLVHPPFFTLENVWMYRKSEAWRIIRRALERTGYGVDWWHLNAADYGVAQSRKRMIVVARRDGRQPAKPWPTHSKTGDMFTEPWQGWYSAIEDLIPDLPETQFAPWQVDRMPEEWKTFLINNNMGNSESLITRDEDKPAFTVVSSLGHKGAMPRAFITPGDNTSNKTVRAADEPMVTVQTRTPAQCPHKALILGQGNRSSLKAGDQPADTVTANGNQTGVKALVMDSANAGSNNGGGTVRANHQPVFTITNHGKRPVKAILTSGRVVSMTPRCLARFQDFPNWFELPGNRALACRGIGGAVPSGLMRAVLRSLPL